VYALIYLRDEDIVLRMFFSGIDKHREYIEKGPAHIKEAFTSDFSVLEFDRIVIGLRKKAGMVQDVSWECQKLCVNGMNHTGQRSSKTIAS
jgi:hypothetical protein